MWETRVETGETWILLLFCLQLVLLSQLYIRNQNGVGSFSSLFNFSTYLRIFGKERPIWHPFQIGLCIFIYSVIALLFTFWYGSYHALPHDPVVFLKTVGALLGLNCIRFVSIQLLAWLFELQTLGRILVQKSLSFHGYVSLMVYAMTLLYYFSPFDRPKFMMWATIGILGLGNLLIQMNLYLNIKGISIRTAVYLFLYICAFKITPWFWIYQWIEQSL